MNKTLTRLASATAASAVAGTGLIALAAPAQAATSIWDKVATCESTNNWSINTGNGFYGGLQFTISTWNGFGGQEFADRADHATREEQITVAQRVLAVQGPGAWPACSKYAGLTKSNGGATSAPAASAVSTTRAVAKASAPTKKTTAAKAETTKTTSSATGEYTVVAGDTLTSIARDHGLSDWHSLYTLNKAQIDNPDMIYVGQHFLLS